MNGKLLVRVPASAVLGLVISMFLPPQALAAVGRTEATYSVTPNGAPSYTIPIRATEGINGLTPRISIDYVGPGANSHVGQRGKLHSRSILGVGFDIAGLSYIRPCPRTIAQDGSAGPVTLTAADRYCLDGARLRLISTGTYGASGTQYRTEVDQLIRVTIMGVANGVPTWFQVERPDGLTYEYGSSADSKLLSGMQAGATPQFWAISKIVDVDGNAIRFVYENDAAINRFRPSYISYTERGGAGHYKINFLYQAATQPTAGVRYTPATTLNAIHKEDKLLDRIELTHDDVVYLAYKLTYQAAGGTSQRLRQVQECAYAPSEDCLPATVLTWQSPTAGHDALTSSSRTVASDLLPLDINGDGIKDLVWSASGTWRYMLGGASGFGSVVNTAVAATNSTKAMVLRWNADEFDDLLIDWSDGKWRVLRGGASGFNTTVVQAGSPSVTSTPSNYTTTVGDLNADGLDDLLQMQLYAAMSVTVRFNAAGGFGASSVAYSDPEIRTQGNGPFIKMTGASSVRHPDFNGDGRVDLLVYGCLWDDEFNRCIGAETRWFQLLSSGNTLVNQGPIPGANYTIQARFGHFNDDSLTDIVYPNTSGAWSIGYGRGSGGLSITNGPSHAAHATYQTLIGDYDGDGLDDLYVTRNSPWQWEILRSTGTGFNATPIPTSIAADGLGWMLLDQDGDLPPDLGRYDVSTYLWRVGTHAGAPGDHLLNATDGLGNGVTFTYLPMTDAAVYVKGTGATAPVKDIEGEQFLVRTMQIVPAGGTSYTLTYKYFTAREHVQGRGYLGLGKREITDNRNGVFTTETFSQTFPYIGAPATVTVKQSSAGSAKTIQSQTHTYLHHVLDPAANNQRYLPYRSQTVTNGYEVGGIRNGEHITQVTETHTVNTWGNSTFVAVDVKDMDALSPETGQIYRTEVTSTFVQDTTSWCIGSPLTRSEKRLLPLGAGSETRAMDWNVDGAMCRITQETIEPSGTSAESLVTDIFYDSCGNVNQLSSKPAGTTGQDRVTTINHASRCQRPESITNPEGHVTGLFYTWALGLPSKHRDPNSLDTDLEYDGFGRLTRQRRPDGTAARFALSACTAGNSWCGKNSGARVKVTRTERSTTDAVLRTDEQFLDGLGRTRWAHTESLESGAAIVETLYDVFGRVNQQTQPYFAGGAVYATILTRDLIGRVTSSNAPISELSTSGRITGFAYEGRNTQVTDPANLVTARTSNVLGQLRSIVDPGTGGLTQYAYHPFGELASIEDTNGHLTGWTVNPRGFMSGNSDPDSGVSTFEVNAFGETTKTRDAKTASPAWTTQFTFDELSRPLTRVEAEGTTTFTWGVAADNTASAKYIGRLKKVTSPGGYEETNTFDLYGRLTQLRTKIETINYDVDQSYAPTTGLPASLTYPASTGSTRFKVDLAYQNNELRSVAQNGGTTVYWTGTSTDAFGHYQDELFGNGILTISDFDQASGLMAGRMAGVGGGTGRIDSTLAWGDLRGNVTQRQDLKLTPTVAESFVNDSISRLDTSTRNGTQNLDLSYDANGNILSKDGQAYVYTGAQTGCSYYAHAQPRAVRKIGSTVYCYDANGNMTKRGGSNITYASYNLPTVINQGSNSSTLSYGAFRNRYKQVAVSSGTTETTIYVAGLFEKVTLPGGVIEYRHTIPGGNGTAAIHTRRSTGINSTFYWHADHLGSPELFTDTGGTAQVRPSFGAFGERRDGTDWNGAPSAADLTTLAGITRRGFTGHEHLDSVGLIHMNGRVYDPGAGRFLSRDPIVLLGNSQSPNGYSYVWNNPLRFVDPSGFTPCEKDRGRGDEIPNTNENPGGIPQTDEVCGAESPISDPARGGPDHRPTPPVHIDGGGGGGDKDAQAREDVTCQSILPDGKVLGDVIQDNVTKISVAFATAGLMGPLGNPGLTKLSAFVGTVLPYGSSDFKNRYRGQASADFLGRSGNFHYYSVGSVFYPSGFLDFGASLYALSSVATGQKPWSDLTGKILSDTSAASVRDAALASHGCKE